MRLFCPHCGRKGVARDSLYNRKVVCPDCKSDFVIECAVIDGPHQQNNQKIIGDPVPKDGKACASCGAEIEQDTGYRLGTGIYCRNCMPTQCTPQNGGTDKNIKQTFRESLSPLFGKGRRSDQADDAAAASASGSNGSKKEGRVAKTDSPGSGETVFCSACGALMDAETAYTLGTGTYCTACVPETTAGG